MITAAVSAAIITFLDLFGWLETIPLLARRTETLTLLLVSALLISLLLERRKRLDSIQDTLDGIVATSILGAQYLPEKETVANELERITRHAEEHIMALGARSRATNYLDAIRDAIQQRQIIYYRLIDGTYIPHELHEHLKTVQGLPNVQIGWTRKEKFGNLTVTDQECIIAFPAPYQNKLSGLRLPGETSSRRYTQYFLEVFSKGVPIRTERALQALCEKCSPNISGNIREIQRLLTDEASLGTEDSRSSKQPDLQ